MSRFVCILLGLILFSVSCGCVSGKADTSPVSVTAETTGARFRIGDVIELNIHVDAPDGTLIKFPGDDLDLKPFIIRERRLSTPERRDRNVHENLILSLSVFEIGEFEIPGIEVSWELSNGETGTASTEPQFIRIESVLTPDDKEPRQLKPIISVPARSRFIIAMIVGSLIVIAAVSLAIILTRKWKRKNLTDIIPVPETLRPADEVALESLANLRESQYLIHGDVKTFFVVLTGILKTYIGHRFAFNAPEHTTGEIRFDLKTIGMEPGVQTDILHLLDLADMVKFAKYLPPDDHCRSAIQKAEQIIIRTRSTINVPQAQAVEQKEGIAS
ncbi:hypothetical protein JW823_02720 [bacterium]|nr:hypothetical protein [candidate division CSSED10-310 bacterium]